MIVDSTEVQDNGIIVITGIMSDSACLHDSIGLACIYKACREHGGRKSHTIKAISAAATFDHVMIDDRIFFA